MANLEHLIEESYKKLLGKLKSHPLEEERFIRIKNKFTQDIDSPRRLHLTKSLTELLDLLERRLLIHPHKIRNINKIIEDFQTEEIQMLIIDHHKLLIENNYNFDPFSYKEENIENEKIVSDHLIPSKVIELISGCIGESWRGMAYELGFKAGDIDKFDQSWDSSSKKSHEVLSAFNVGEYCCKRGLLLHALTNIRKNHLKNEVEQLFMKSCIDCRLQPINT